MQIVSACLAGIKCRYNGESFPVPEVTKMVKEGEAIPVCPEILGGLPIPRQPGEQYKGKVLAKNGEDVTDEYVRGAGIALQIALLAGCSQAVLKARSPSCGSDRIYDGTFSGRLIDGDGIFAKLLKDHGITVYMETEFHTIEK